MTFPSPKPFVLPGVSLLLRFDGIGAALKPLLEQMGSEQGPFARSEAGGLVIYALKGPLPIDGLQPVIALEGNDLIVATTREYFDACVASGNRLQDNPAFRASLAAVGTEGNGLGYVHPRLFAELRRLKELNPEMPAEATRVLDMAFRGFPQTDFPLVAVRVNRPDGILFVSSLNRSLKQDVAVLAMYNPVSIGLMASMAIPAFNKVRANSQTKAIQNNLRQLESAGLQYCLENNAESATYAQLVGPEEGKYIRALTPVAGEDYTGLVVKPNVPLTVTTASGEEITVGGD